MKTQSGLMLALLPFLFGLVAACGASTEKPGAPPRPSDPPEADAAGSPSVEVGARPYQVDLPSPSDGTAVGGATDDSAPHSTAPAAGGAAGGAQADDETVAAPRVVSVWPESGARAVGAGAHIVIEFSRPMDPRTTLAAWQSDALPRDQVDFTWNDDGTVLTVTPQRPLEYAHATLSDDEHPELAARSYGYTLSSLATDRLGRALAATAVSFSTLREFTHTLHSLDELTGIVVDPQQPEQLTGFATIDLAPLPPDIRVLERAVARTSEYQLPAPVTVSQVAFEQLDASALLAPSRGAVTTLPAGTSGALLIPESLWRFLAADYRARTGARTYSQYRFDLPPGTDAHVAERLLKDSMLELDYVAP